MYQLTPQMFQRLRSNIASLADRSLALVMAIMGASIIKVALPVTPVNPQSNALSNK